MKIAVVHDWVVTYAGAERVLEQILKVFPDADVFSTVDFVSDDRSWLLNKKVITTFIQRLPFSKSKYRAYLPLMPFAVEQLDLSGYDLVISSSHSVAKGVLTGPNQLHICMCYSPIRYAWDLQHQYLRESGYVSGFKSILVRYLLHKIRIWDVRTANGVDRFISISKYISRRIEKVYGKQSHVIYPPVYTDSFSLVSDKKDYYFTSSRLVPYKRIDLIVSTFARYFPNKKLVVIGDGPELSKIKKIAEGRDNIEILGYQNFSVLKMHLAYCKCFIFAAEEDFGIAPLEAQASGTPVIAFSKGAALETIQGNLNLNKPTGIFFDEQTEESLKAAIEMFETVGDSINPEDCFENAERFSTERFISNFKLYVESEYSKWKN